MNPCPGIPAPFPPVVDGARGSVTAASSMSATYVKIAGRRVAVNVMTFGDVQEPRLRFDRVALGLVRRLQASLSRSVPDGKAVIVTVTAPIRQDSRTGAALEDRIRELLAARRAQLKATIHGNRIQVRVLQGGARRTSKLVGFVHNPKPDPSLLFDVTRSLLACIGSGKRPPRGDRWLIVANQDGLAPVETVRQVCLALRARTVFKRILLEESEGVRVL
jgi:hypothetical protein